MEKIFRRERKRLLKEKSKKHLDRMCLTLLLSVLLSAGLLLTQPVYAEESGTQKVKLVLLDEKSGERIEGAQFTLAEKKTDSYEDMDGKTEIIVSEDGYDFGKLKFGEYQLTELKAAGGYIISSGVIKFQVSEQGVILTNEANAAITNAQDGTYEINVSNPTFNVLLPSTGGAGTLSYTVSGILLIAAAFVSDFALQRKRRESN